MSVSFFCRSEGLGWDEDLRRWEVTGSIFDVFKGRLMVNAVCNPKMPVSHLTVSTVLPNYYRVQVSYLTHSALNSTPTIELEKANR